MLDDDDNSEFDARNHFKEGERRVTLDWECCGVLRKHLVETLHHFVKKKCEHVRVLPRGLQNTL